MRTFSIKGQTAFITGASSGIGKACAEQFASMGVNLVIAARRLNRLTDLAIRLSEQFSVRVIPVELDVQINDQIEAVFRKLKDDKIEIDILINNAGLALSTDKIHKATIENWDIMIDTNIKGLLYVTRATLPNMIERNKGHIINIGSVAGHECYTGGNIYSATKHAVRAITKSLRIDLFGTALRVSEIDPGAVETEFSEVRWKDKDKAKKLYEGFNPLVADDIADVAVYCATRPPHVNVSEIIVYPQAQASVSQIYRESL
jgi:3-hydroxy acid dehydrogenase / malonic semialdehyde reductase